MLNLSLNQIKRNQIKYKIIKDIRNLFKLVTKDNTIQDKALRDIRALFESDKDEYYKPIKTSNAFNSNYIEYDNNGDKDKSLSVKESLSKIRPYLSHIINDIKTQAEWKVELTVAINFMSSIDSKNSKDSKHSKDSSETPIMHTRSNNIETMIGNETDEIIKELYDSLLPRHQEGLGESMKGSKFVFDSASLLYYKFHKMSLNRVRSYIDSTKWLKINSTINPRNNDNRCFQYAVVVAINHHPERIPNIH